jgi:hypothetical protein
VVWGLREIVGPSADFICAVFGHVVLVESALQVLFMQKYIF